MPNLPSAAPPIALPPLFMWAGGKRRLLPKYAPYFPQLSGFSAYVEPFLGGGAVFSYVAAHRPGMPAVLGDVNDELVRLYTHVKQEPDRLLKATAGYEAKWMPLTVAQRKTYYYALRELYWDMPESVESSALLYFLMKTGFNGIWQSCVAAKGRYGTPVGLANQKSRVIDPQLVAQWSEALRNTDVLSQSYEKTKVPKGAFVYCDPPYRGSFTNYSTGFDDADQIKLVAWCRKTAQQRQALVWLANREVGDGFFETHAPEARIEKVPVIYTAGRRKRTEGGFEAKPAVEVLLMWDGRPG